MNIIEVGKKENVGKKYKAYNGIWVLKEEANGTLELYNENEVGITNLCYVSEIINLEFEEVFDWSKAPVDTPILVRDDEDADWIPRHFAKCENGVVYAWASGKTSHTIGNRVVMFNEWKYVKLYEKGDELYER